MGLKFRVCMLLIERRGNLVWQSQFWTLFFFFFNFVSCLKMSRLQRLWLQMKGFWYSLTVQKSALLPVIVNFNSVGKNILWDNHDWFLQHSPQKTFNLQNLSSVAAKRVREWLRKTIILYSVQSSEVILNTFHCLLSLDQTIPKSPTSGGCEIVFHKIGAKVRHYCLQPNVP